MRRIAATLLVIASPAILAVPVGASDGGNVGPRPTPTVVPPVAVSVVPPVTRQVAPAVPAPAPVLRTAPAVVRPPAVKAVRPRAITPSALDDAVYAEKLQADLCLARAIFCGVDHSGHYRVR